MNIFLVLVSKNKNGTTHRILRIMQYVILSAIFVVSSPVALKNDSTQNQLGLKSLK